MLRYTIKHVHICNLHRTDKFVLYHTSFLQRNIWNKKGFPKKLSEKYQL